ncbi:DUF1499 domain-containing protein [Vibrio aphrogenes]|uniref:DUF1499 domain-containing protein n=1 Tax=Vibrio aphrogenes TaxID=1891186 RepID=UPI000B34B758|nr:DUF1499 domain-containing protein [Vibrio aphrogenes]
MIGQRINAGNIALVIAVLCFAIALLMVFGSQLGLWEPIVGFSASRNYNNTVGYLAVVVGLFGFFISLKQQQKSGVFKSILAVVLGIGILMPMIVGLLKTPVRYPPIHDITTNLEQPPLFQFLTDDRPGAKNTLVYGGEEIAHQQLKAYPDIKPLISSLAPHAAYRQALEVAEQLNWTLVYQDFEQFHFEATARTAFFNFADDVVVQVVALEGGSRVDVRSVSRIGRSDRGVNAQRIREFIQQFKENESASQ